MKIVNKPEYVAEDGRKFADKSECLKYEREEMQLGILNRRVAEFCNEKLEMVSPSQVSAVSAAVLHFGAKPKDLEGLLKGLKLPKTGKAAAPVKKSAPKPEKPATKAAQKAAPKVEVKVEAPKPIDKTQPYLKVTHGPDRAKTEIQMKLGTTVEVAHSAIANLTRPIHDLQLMANGRGQILPIPAK